MSVVKFYWEKTASRACGPSTHSSSNEASSTHSEPRATRGAGNSVCEPLDPWRGTEINQTGGKRDGAQDSKRCGGQRLGRESGQKVCGKLGVARDVEPALADGRGCFQNRCGSISPLTSLSPTGPKIFPFLPVSCLLLCIPAAWVHSPKVR